MRAVFVGRPMSIDGRSYADHLAELAAIAGIACEFRPQVNDPAEMVELYEQARVVAVPSRYEPLSMVVLEALASGRPVVMTKQVGASEWVSDTFPDAIVPADDPAAFADALRPHLESADHARAAGQRGRALVCGHLLAGTDRRHPARGVPGRTRAGGSVRWQVAADARCGGSGSGARCSASCDRWTRWRSDSFRPTHDGSATPASPITQTARSPSTATCSRPGTAWSTSGS